MPRNTPAELAFYQHVGRAVRAERLAQRLTLACVAAECGVTGNSISRMENGHRSLSVVRLVQIAAALAVPISRLIPADARHVVLRSGPGSLRDE